MELSAIDRKLLRRYFVNRPIRRAYVFGSYARGTAARENSDLDILVESRPRERRGPFRHLKPFVDQYKVLIYEKRS